MAVMHEGSCLFIPRSNGTRLMLAEDVNLTEACEMMLDYGKVQFAAQGKPVPITSLPVRKTLRKSVRRQSQTGWPKV